MVRGGDVELLKKLFASLRVFWFLLKRITNAFCGDGPACEYYQLRGLCFRVTLPTVVSHVAFRRGDPELPIPGPFILACR
jgi:hypothetical protein